MDNETEETKPEETAPEAVAETEAEAEAEEETAEELEARLTRLEATVSEQGELIRSLVPPAEVDAIEIPDETRAPDAEPESGTVITVETETVAEADAGDSPTEAGKPAKRRYFV